jgi:hypothetical protein
MHWRLVRRVEGFDLAVDLSAIALDADDGGVAYGSFCGGD